MITFFIAISTFAINVVTMLGLGLAIDYALFMVNRFREELSQGHSVDSAVACTTATVGRIVAFSALTVAISLVASWTARGFSRATIDNDVGVLERMLDALGRPAWEVTVDDVDRVVGLLASQGRAVSTRRNYLQVFKGFHGFLEVRKAAEIEALFGVRLACPVDEFNAARHVGEDSPVAGPPPLPERVSGFSTFLKRRIVTARKYAPAARRLCIVSHLVSRRFAVRGGGHARTSRMYTSIAGRSGSCMSGSVRAPRRLAPARGGCRCWMAWIESVRAWVRLITSMRLIFARWTMPPAAVLSYPVAGRKSRCQCSRVHGRRLRHHGVTQPIARNRASRVPD